MYSRDASDYHKTADKLEAQSLYVYKTLLPTFDIKQLKTILFHKMSKYLLDF